MNYVIKKLLKKPVLFSALLCAVLTYSVSFQYQEEKVSSLIPLEKISEIEGKLLSSPVKTSSFGGAYLSTFELFSVKTQNDSMSSAKGKLTIVVPAAIVESLFPDKIYTESRGKSGVLFESGVSLKLSGKSTGSEFLVSSAAYSQGGWKKGLLGSVAKFRAFCRLRFRFVMKSWGDAGGLFLALLSGAREYTDSSVAAAFRDAGLSHVLALSGMHLSLFGFLSLSLGKILSGKKFSAFLYLFSILFFVWFAGLSPSLVRALLCALIVFFAGSLRLSPPDGITMLSLSFLIHIFIFPHQSKELAFILSYLSLSGIFFAESALLPYLSRIFPPFLSSAFSASIGAQSFTAPVSLYVFKKIAPVGIISTIVISPLITVFMYTGIFALILCMIAPFLSAPFNVIMNFIYGIVKNTALFFAGVPAFTIG